MALIGDPRNDENIIVSQLHLTFIRFHNRVVDQVADAEGLEGPDLFKRLSASSAGTTSGSSSTTT